MKIFFTASLYGKQQYQKYYDLVLKTLQKYCNDVISTETKSYLKTLTDKQKFRLKDLRKIHYESVRKSILLSDLVVIEISHQDFQLGHEATLALNNKKPVLCLSLIEDMSQKINHKLFFGARYDENNLDHIVQTFVAKHSKAALNQRFNMFLTKSQLGHLNVESASNDMTVSEYMRYLIDKDRGFVS